MVAPYARRIGVGEEDAVGHDEEEYDPVEPPPLDRVYRQPPDRMRDREEAEARAAKLASRERAVRALEQTWNDRYEDLVAREETTSKMQHRMARQREALEQREGDLIEAEERTRIELVELAAKRRALHDLEALLDRRQGEVSARELDADALLSEAYNERELIREFEAELERKWERLAELAMELEERKDETVTD